MKKQTSQPTKRNNQNTRPSPKRPPPVKTNQRTSQNRKASDQRRRNPNAVRQHVQGQNPIRRKQQRVRINPHDIEIRKRREEAKRFYIKKQRENFIKLAVGRIVLFLILFATVFVVAVGLLFLDLFKDENSIIKLSYEYQIGEDEDENKISKTLSMREYSFDGEKYIDISEIAKLYKFTVTGNNIEYRYIFPESKDEVKFIVGTSEAHLNGTCIRLRHPVYNRNDKVLVPISFYTKYVRGINISVDDEARKIKLTRTVIGEDKKGNKIYEPISLTVKHDESTERIPESSLDYDLRMLTEPRRPYEGIEAPAG